MASDLPGASRRHSFTEQCADIVASSYDLTSISDRPSVVQPQPTPTPPPITSETTPESATTKRVTETLLTRPHSLIQNLVVTNVIALTVAAPTFLITHLFFTLANHLEAEHSIGVPQVCGTYSFVAQLLTIFLFRRREPRMRQLALIQGPVGVLLPIPVLATGIDFGQFGIAVGFALYYATICSGYAADSKPGLRGFLRWCGKALPMVFMLMASGAVPAWGTTIPAVLFQDEPTAYILWCGLGYPGLSFLVRKAFLGWVFSGMMRQIKEGAMTYEQFHYVVPAVTFCTGSMLMFGNVILMYTGESVRVCISSALVSIATEIAGKVYVVFAMKRMFSLKGTAKEEIEDAFAMLATRWTQEIIVENGCIVLSCWLSRQFSVVGSDRSWSDQLYIFAVFFACEVVADGAVVYGLDRWLGVPFLRVPLPSLREKSRFAETLTSMLTLFGVILCFKYAHHSTNQWFGGGGGEGVGRGEGGGNVTLVY